MAAVSSTAVRTASPVPSITLSITKRDAEQFLQASEALRTAMDNTSSSSPERKSRPLHERLREAARQCADPLIVSFLERISSAMLSDKEVQAAILLFYDAPQKEKLQHYLTALETSTPLSKQVAVSLFRSILTSLSACVHTPEKVLIEGKPHHHSPSDEPPTKRIKRESDTVTTKALTEEQEFRPCQSPSFDSSLATLRDEDDSVNKEIQEIATYAADQLWLFYKEQPVPLEAFLEWYQQEGSEIVHWLELLQHASWKTTLSTSTANGSSVRKEPPKTVKKTLESAEPPVTGQVVISFDFTGTGPKPLHVSITEDNILALRSLVRRTDLRSQPASEVCRKLRSKAIKTLVGSESVWKLTRDDFHECLDTLIPSHTWDGFSEEERVGYRQTFDDFFDCFQKSPSDSAVDLKAFCVGFTFFCGGNKSTKLMLGFEILDDKQQGVLSEQQLELFLQSYLTALVGMSFLTPNSKPRKGNVHARRDRMRTAVESGTKWTLNHFFRSNESSGSGDHSFEAFASWYSNGGYHIAPWLELLDLKKILALIQESSSPLQLPPLSTRRPRDRVSTLRRHHQSRRRLSTPEILFTFPMAARRQLVVLKEDAIYVRGAVEQLDMLHLKPDELWESLSEAVEKRRGKARGDDVTVYVDGATFVDCMEEVCPRLTRKRSAPGVSLQGTPSEELLSNFFQCFDVNQVDSVALDELMGGLTLLCGGKKSTKLAFAFSVFDTRPEVQHKRGNTVHSLSGEDLFLFLRSILIVTFSCCRQSLDMTDEVVGQCIADTANYICNDVMRHQWETKQLDRLDFDEFGQWYNDGGFERAPWLELLDLNKWVLCDFKPPKEPAAPVIASPRPPAPLLEPPPSEPTVPPLPPEEELDHAFFDENTIMPMDSMDEMDMMLMPNPSTDKEIDLPDHAKLAKSFSFSPGASPKHLLHRSPNQRSPNQRSPNQQSPRHRSPGSRKTNALKFHLVTNEKEGGYMLSLSQARIRQFRHVLQASGIHELEPETVCNAILSRAARTLISRDAFEQAMEELTGGEKNGRKRDAETDRMCKEFFGYVFTAFDTHRKGKANAMELACGFTVLCRGKKSDKLEFAFEVLDKTKHGRLSRGDTTSYLQSFLAVLLSVALTNTLQVNDPDDSVTTMNGSKCDKTIATVIRAFKAGAHWASALAFTSFGKGDGHAISFDDFAEWYTQAGYSSIPWLELLDLHKWVLASAEPSPRR